MSDQKQALQERRRYPRYPVTAELYVVFRDSKTRLGRIIDISAGGLAFCLLGPDDPKNLGKDMDLFIANREPVVYRLPYRVRSATVLSESVTFRDQPARRCGVELGPLSSLQSRAYLSLVFCATM